MKTGKASGSVRERILETAFTLFYQQGYRTTGINQIIAESGVAKASFYAHFPSKDDLLRAYAQTQAAREFAELKAFVEKVPHPRKRFFAAFQTLRPWLESTRFRGCPFQNLMVEVPPEAKETRQVGAQHRENLRGLFREVTRNLIAHDARLRHLDVERVVDTYLLLFDGAIALAVAYQDASPVDQAIQAMERYLRSGA